MTLCQVCGIPADAGFFDRSSIVAAPVPGSEAVLAVFEVPRNYCGQLLYFAQYVDREIGASQADMTTPGYAWELRLDGRPYEPYRGFEHIVNPWGLHGFPLAIRLPDAAVVELVVRNLGTGPALCGVGGRLIGRYWYNTVYGGTPNPL